MEAHSGGASSDEEEENFTCAGGVLALFASPNLCRRSILLFTVWFAVPATYFGLSLNGRISGDDADDSEAARYLSYVFYGLIELPAIGASVALITTAGRRVPLALLLLGAGLACSATVLVPPGEYENDWPALALAVVGKFCSTVCLQVSYVDALKGVDLDRSRFESVRMKRARIDCMTFTPTHALL